MFSLFGTPDHTKGILDRYLDAHFYCVAARDSAPDKQTLEELGRRLACKFPKEFIAHSTNEFGGIYIEVKEEFWPRAEEFAVGPFWSFLYGLYVYGYTPEIPEWMNLDVAAKEFREMTGHPHVPCLKVIGDADIFAFTPTGDIVQWSHEADEFTPFDGSFFALLEQEVRELRERKDRKLAAT